MHYFQKVSGKTGLTKKNKQRTNAALGNKEENLQILQKKKKRPLSLFPIKTNLEK